MVLIDETQVECAREHDCPSGRVCPLARYFADPKIVVDSDTAGIASVLH